MTEKKRKAAAKSTPPWKRKAPKGTKSRKLALGQLAVAKKLAEEAGRPYPNLVDNMRAARLRD